MSDYVSAIWKFFENKSISISKKISIVILIILSALAVDNIGGFSYRYMNSQKLDYLLKIEKTKEQFNQDKVVCDMLDKMKYELINRKNIFEKFFDLFDNQDIEKNKLSNDKIGIYNQNIQRNQFLHTISSSLFWIIWLIIFLFILIISPFAPSKDKYGIMLGMIIGISGMSILIWTTQWLFGLLPIFFDRPWINYIFQFIINLIPISILTYGSIKQKHIT